MEPSESRFGGPGLVSINSMPPELLSHIFLSVDTQYCYGISTQSQLYPPYFPLRSNSTPSHLGSVCTYWRKVSLATPALWASLHIIIPGFNHSGILERVRTHLERSGSSLLSIILSGDRALSNDDLDLVSEAVVAAEPFQNLPGHLLVLCEVLRSIFHQADRITRFSLRIPGQVSTASLLLRSQHRFVTLSHLSIPLQPQESMRSLFDMLGSLSCLRSLEIFDLEPREVDRTMASKLAQITRIRIGLATLDQICTLLSFCPNVCSARVALCDSRNYHSPPNIPNLPLLHLHAFHIDIDAFTQMECVAALFTAMVVSPRLTELTVTTSPRNHAEQRAQDVLFPALQPLLTNLDTFCIEGFHLDRSKFSLLLERMPNLCHLEVVDIKRWVEEYNRAMFVGLLEDLSEWRVTPRLTTLRLSLRNWVGDNLFENMLESRVGTLHSVYLELVEGTGARLDLKRLRALQDQGLAVRVVEVARYFGLKGKIEIVGYQKEATVKK
ncbi:hypothetical protein WG66_009831 [Moniliophthora roreri]|nr:hypothetical protein WG66_009831 [Moniliophthora roreri]